MTRLTVNLLGPPEVRHGGSVVRFATRKTLALLAFLAAEPGAHARERLTALLWPESDYERGPGSLRRTLAYLRDGLGDRDGQPHLVSAAGRVQLGDEIELDLSAVRESLTGAPDLARLTAAARTIRGQFLEGLSLPDSEEFDAWASLEREAWHARGLQVFDRLTALQAEAGDSVAVLDLTTRWIAFDSLDEAAHRRLMQIHLVRGDRSAALRAYQACRRLLADELGAEPDPATEAVYQLARTTHTPVAWPNPAPPEPAAEAPMVGRSDEHRRLVAGLRNAATGLHIAVVEGESGIGKSRLVREYSAWAAANRVRVLVGSTDAVAAGVPYQVISDALRSGLATVPDPRALLGDIWLAEVSRLVPEVAERCPGLARPIDDAGARIRLFESATRLIQALACQQPVVLVQEDLHWAEDASRDLLAYAVRRWAERNVPVFLVITARTDDPAATEWLRTWFVDLERISSLERIMVRPLSAADTRELVDHWPGAEHLAQHAARLHQDTGGRPLLLTERLRYVLEGGSLDELAPGTQQIIRARTSRLSRSARDLANAAATLGRTASFDILAQVAGLDGPEALDGLEELLGRRLLQGTRDGYELSHADLQRAVYADLQDERRKTLHQRALHALAATAEPAELLRHAQVTDDRAATYLHALAAARFALQVCAPREAVAHFKTAFAANDTLDQAQLELARAFELIEDASAAREVYQSVHARASSVGDQLLSGRALAAWSVLEAQAMHLEQAQGLAVAASDAARASADDTTQVEAALSSALISTYATDLDTALDRAIAASETASAIGSIELLARSLNALAFSRQLRGDWYEIEASAAQAAELFERLGDRAMYVDSRCYGAGARIALGDHQGGIALAREALEVSRAIDNAWGIAHSAHHLAWGLLDAGEYGQLLEIGELAIESARASRFAPMWCLNLVVVGAAKRAIQDFEQAIRIHREALDRGRELGGLARELAAGQLCADLVAIGNWTAAAEVAVEARAARTQARMFSDLTRAAQTEALLRTGEVDSLPDPLPGERYEIPMLHARSILAAARGDLTAATDDASTAAEIAARLRLPGDEWILRRALARLHSAAGEMSAARTERRRALQVVSDLAARTPSDQVHGLRQLEAELSH